MVDRHKIQMIDSTIKNLSKTLEHGESNMTTFHKGKMTELTPLTQAILMTNVMKSVQYDFTVITETKMHDLFELNVRFSEMER